MAELRTIRRVVTGQAKDGKTVIASDTEVLAIKPPLLPDATFFDLWGANSLPTLPNDGTKPDYVTWFPPVGGIAGASSPCRPRPRRKRSAWTGARLWPRPGNCCRA
jgi:hypothetical protein